MHNHLQKLVFYVILFVLPAFLQLQHVLLVPIINFYSQILVLQLAILDLLEIL